MEEATYHTGDIITARVKSLPWIFHRGIIIMENDIPWVIHNSPGNPLNSSGGSINFSTLSSYLSTRKLTSTRSTNLDRTTIENLTIPLLHRKFGWVNWNCEHFTSSIETGKPRSVQIQTAIMLIGIITFILGFRQNVK